MVTLKPAIFRATKTLIVYIILLVSRGLNFYDVLWQRPRIHVSDKVYNYYPEIQRHWRTYWLAVSNKGKKDVINMKFCMMFRKLLECEERISVSYPVLTPKSWTCQEA
jgi:hypothetical protein